MTPNSIKNLHQKYASGKYKNLYLELVWTHSVIVSEIALQLAKNLKSFNLNVELITQGSLLHDIGMYACYDDELNPTSELPALQHGFEGAKILTQENISSALQRFCLTHIAVGLTAEDIQREKLNIAIQDYLPITVEEELVCYADKFHTKYPAFVDDVESIKSRLAKFDAHRAVRFDTMQRKYGVPDLSSLEKKYANWAKSIATRIDAL